MEPLHHQAIEPSYHCAIVPLYKRAHKAIVSSIQRILPSLLHAFIPLCHCAFVMVQLCLCTIVPIVLLLCQRIIAPSYHQSIVSTEDFDVDSNCDFEHVHDEKNDDACDTTIVSSTSFIQQSINPPSGIKFGFHLQQILSSHHCVELPLYMEIIDTIKFHSTVQNTDFSAT